MSIFREFLEFLKERRKFWLIPILVMLALVIGLVVVAQGAGGVAPFIYALF